MAYAMVSTVSPNANATPRNPIPRVGNPAASTALPHPPSTSHNVPTNSAATLLDSGICAMCVPPGVSLWLLPTTPKLHGRPDEDRRRLATPQGKDTHPMGGG